MKQFKTGTVTSKSNKYYSFYLLDKCKVVKKFVVSTPISAITLISLARHNMSNGLEVLDIEATVEPRGSELPNIMGLARFLDTLAASSYEEEKIKLTLDVTEEEKDAILTALKIKRTLG